jgi:hypothetical protein
MKNIFWFAFLLLATRLAVGQVPKTKHAEPDLKRFSSSQLRACFDDKTICGADDVYEVSDELIRRLPTLRTDQLVACFDNWKICGMGNDLTNGWAISNELARRGNPHALLARYWTEPNESIRYGIVHVAYQFRNSEITGFMPQGLRIQTRR